MANCVVLGTQWGDEGKGKLIDLLTPSFDVVARFQGGHNAGHTVYVSGKKIILHLIPSGILHSDKLCLIGNGVVFSPRAFLNEKEELSQAGINVGDNLLISKNAHLILPYHPAIENISEELRGDNKIGTTSRGIGPAYVDKVSRQGIKVGDMLNLQVLEEKIMRNIEEKNMILACFGKSGFDAREVFKEFREYAKQIAPYIDDVSFVVQTKLNSGNSVLFEGAQGTLLDIDHGTFPYVTSSNTTVGGVCAGLGIGFNKIDAVFGVTKAYSTRVGGGPFPSELTGEMGKMLMEKGNEYGATTGRPRRCGWFDAVVVGYSCRLNGIEKILLTKSDVLDGFNELKVCTGYKYKGQLLKSFPTEEWILEIVEPQYKTVKGWKGPINDISDVSKLPQEFKDYIRLIEDLLQVRVAIISTGFERKDTILINDMLAGLIDLEIVKKAIQYQ